MQLLILTTLLAVAFAAPMQQSLSVQDDGSYQFYYETGKDGGSHSRSEVRHPDGVVIGKFSYEDPNGDIREVNYRADDSGYVANGDVGVEGAPKGQFPAAPEDEAALEEVKDQQDPEPQSQTAPDEDQDKQHQEESHKAEDDMRDLALDESAVNDSPEGFPQGFFLQHFQGLRRLPEPTAEESTTTQQPPVEEDKKEADQPQKQPDNAQPEDLQNETKNEEEPGKNFDNEMKLFTHLRPFQNFAPQPIDSTMFHQPVYVFSYHNPDSYGYHYYF